MYSDTCDEGAERERVRARRHRLRRMADNAAEEQLPALERAHRMEALGVSPVQWATDELEAYCAEAYQTWPELATMSDDELEELARGQRRAGRRHRRSTI